MERLTARSPKNGMTYLVKVKPEEQAVDGTYDTLMCIREAFDRLAEYEESDLQSQLAEAQADNAALVEALDKIREQFRDYFHKSTYYSTMLNPVVGNDYLREINKIAMDTLAKPRPGAPLMAELEQLRKDLAIERKINAMLGEWIDDEEMDLLDVCPEWCECYGENPCSFQLEWNARKQIQTPEEVTEWSKSVNCPDCEVSNECGGVEGECPFEKAGEQ